MHACKNHQECQNGKCCKQFSTKFYNAIDLSIIYQYPFNKRHCSSSVSKQAGAVVYCMESTDRNVLVLLQINKSNSSARSQINSKATKIEEMINLMEIITILRICRLMHAHVERIFLLSVLLQYNNQTFQTYLCGYSNIYTASPVQ